MKDKTAHKSKILAIHTRGTTDEERLSWWNVSKVNLHGVEYILTHDGHSNVTGFYKLTVDKNGNYRGVNTKIASSKPYASLTSQPDGQKRVSFLPFAKSQNRPILNMPKTKRGQANPLEIFNFDPDMGVIERKDVINIVNEKKSK